MIEKVPDHIPHMGEDMPYTAWLIMMTRLNEVIDVVNRMERVQPGVIIGTPQTHNGSHFVTGLSIAENTPKSSGFRPLHIEDGQVQEAMADNLQAQIDERKELWDYEVRENIIKQRHIVALSEEVVELEKDKETLMEWLRDSRESAKRLRTKVDAMERDLNILLVESGKTPIPSVPEAEPQEQEPFATDHQWLIENQAIVTFLFVQGASRVQVRGGGGWCERNTLAEAVAFLRATYRRESAQPAIRPDYENTIPQAQWSSAESAATAARQRSAAQPGKGV